MIEVPMEIQEKLKEQRLKQLEARYYELQMDKAALEANDDVEGVKATERRMEHVIKAYEAVKEL